MLLINIDMAVINWYWYGCYIILTWYWLLSIGASKFLIAVAAGKHVYQLKINEHIATDIAEDLKALMKKNKPKKKKKKKGKKGGKKKKKWSGCGYRWFVDS